MSLPFSVSLTQKESLTSQEVRSALLDRKSIIREKSMLATVMLQRRYKNKLDKKVQQVTPYDKKDLDERR